MKKYFLKITAILFLVLSSIISHAQCLKEISCGSIHTLAIKTDGTLWAWGYNNIGQLGDGTTIQKNSPTLIGNDTEWNKIEAGFQHTLALKNNGTLWAWGSNSYGDLGDGTTVSTYTPIQIGSDTNWKSIGAGMNYSVALKTDGTVWAWGYNVQGELGDGTFIEKHVPNQVGTANNWDKIAVGNGHVIALRTDGTLWAWGWNNNGQLGDGTSVNKNIPIQIGTDANWSKISAGGGHTIAIKSNGTLWAWGSKIVSNSSGIPSFVNVYVPTQIGSDTNWNDIKAGNNYSLALKTDGTLWAWGGNLYGEIGDGTTDVKYVPTQIGADTNWSKIGANGYGTRSLALKNDGALWGWGRNNVGQIGDGTIIDRLIPTPIACPTSLATENIAIRNNFKIFPNPVVTNLTIEANEVIIETSITDCNGRVINIEKQNKSSVSINLENLQPGIYFLKMVTENNSTIEKLLKK